MQRHIHRIEWRVRSIQLVLHNHVTRTVSDNRRERPCLLQHQLQQQGRTNRRVPPQVQLRENDPTAPMRLQFSQQVLQSNPKYQAQLQQDPLFQANLQKYIENLQFSVQQQQNAITGRLGVQ